MSDMTQILTITDAALAKILEVRADEPEPANQAPGARRQIGRAHV